MCLQHLSLRAAEDNAQGRSLTNEWEVSGSSGTVSTEKLAFPATFCQSQTGTLPDLTLVVGPVPEGELKKND